MSSQPGLRPPIEIPGQYVEAASIQASFTRGVLGDGSRALARDVPPTIRDVLSSWVRGSVRRRRNTSCTCARCRKAEVVPPNPAVRRHASRSFAAPETHNVARRATLAQKGGHGFHVRVNVSKPGLQSGAEIIQSALAARRPKKTVLGASPQHSNRKAHSRQRRGSVSRLFDA